ncbi:MAG: TonB-dependent receptor [Bacteroidales bacterium]|nr:TonB-dependent receptor [Bacteroidales bacterium]
MKSNNGVIQNIVPADISLTIKHWGENILTVGSDYQGADYANWSDILKGSRLFGNKSTAYQAGIYAQEEVHFGKLIWRGGVRFNYIKNNIELVDGGAPGSTSQDWKSFLWSTGLKVKADENIAFFVNAGNSFLTPGLKAIGGTIKLSDKGVVGHNGQLPNPDLKPESGVGIDWGTDITLLQNLKISARGFYFAISDAIVDNVVSQTPSQTQSINAGKTTSIGAEFEIKQFVTENIQWFANYTLMKTKVKDGETVPFAPEQVANAGIDFSTSFGLSISPYLNFNDGFYDSSSKTGRNFFKPGALLNINASQVLAKTDGFKVEFFGQLYNVTNNKYKMPWQFQDPGFSLMAGIRATF